MCSMNIRLKFVHCIGLYYCVWYMYIQYDASTDQDHTPRLESLYGRCCTIPSDMLCPVDISHTVQDNLMHCTEYISRFLITILVRSKYRPSTGFSECIMYIGIPEFVHDSRQKTADSSWSNAKPAFQNSDQSRMCRVPEWLSNVAFMHCIICHVVHRSRHAYRRFPRFFPVLSMSWQPQFFQMPWQNVQRRSQHWNKTENSI